VPGDRETGRVEALTAAIADRSRLTVTAAKEIVDGRADADRIAWWHRQVLDSGEAREGVAAFAERRPPRFGWTPPGRA
jgi:enoyl-CoA hydratase/carnithine racemase